MVARPWRWWLRTGGYRSSSWWADDSPAYASQAGALRALQRMLDSGELRNNGDGQLVTSGMGSFVAVGAICSGDIRPCIVVDGVVELQA